jgi:hypothetical protein
MNTRQSRQVAPRMRRVLHIRAAYVFAVLVLALAGPPTRAWADFSQDFEVDTSGWFTLGTDTVNREADGYVSPDYASGINSASPTHHARLRRGACGVDLTGGGGPTVQCEGPFTRWGGYNSVWMGGYTTAVDVYLDVAYAQANPDSYPGNIGCLTADSSNTSCNGTRFDFSSAINDPNGNFLQDYAFDVGTGDPAQPTPCASGGFVVTARTNVFRSGANIYDPNGDPFCIANSGWYTLKHTFMDVGGFLHVLMEILPSGSNTPLHSWTIVPGHAIADVGCNRYGWFAEQEIWDLPIDNSVMMGCGAPLPTTTTTTTTSSTTTTTQCVPTGPENATASCSDMIDNDCNGQIDCADPSCNGIFPCPRARKDPTTIQFGRNGAFDKIRGHAKLTMAPVDITTMSVGVLLTQPSTVIYSNELAAGALTGAANGTIFRFQDLNARSTGGFSSVKIKSNNDGSYTFSFAAYGDLSAATDPNMRLQFYMGTDPNAARDGRIFITLGTPWSQTRHGWRAPKDH